MFPNNECIYQNTQTQHLGNKRKETKAAGGLQVLPTLQVLERTTWVPGGNSHIKSIVVPVRNFEKKNPTRYMYQDLVLWAWLEMF